MALSERSLRNLRGVHEDLVDCVKLAHDMCSYDFTVVEGLRTLETQKAYLAKGATSTLRSYHILGRAVDLMLFKGNTILEDITMYAHVADCMDASAEDLGIEITWGAVWDKRMSDYDDANKEFKEYIAQRRYKGKRPFVDAVHFQLEPYK